MINGMNVLLLTAALILPEIFERLDCKEVYQLMVYGLPVQCK